MGKHLPNYRDGAGPEKFTVAAPSPVNSIPVNNNRFVPLAQPIPIAQSAPTAQVPGSNVLSNDAYRPSEVVHTSAPADTLYPNLYTETSRINQFGSGSNGYKSDPRTDYLTKPLMPPVLPQPTSAPRYDSPQASPLPTNSPQYNTPQPTQRYSPQPTQSQTTQSTFRPAPTQPPTQASTQRPTSAPEFKPQEPQGFQTPNREVIDEVKIKTPPRTPPPRQTEADDDDDDDDSGKFFYYFFCPPWSKKSTLII